MLEKFFNNLDEIILLNPSVPIEMQNGNEDEEGWIKWQPVTSTITDFEIENLEDKLHIKLPRSFIDYLTYKHFLDLDFGWIILFGIPSDQGISAIHNWIFNMSMSKSCLENGYIIFGSDGNSSGYFCLDTNNNISINNSIEYPIVFIEQSQLRIKTAKKIAGDFNELLEIIFSKEESNAVQ